MRRVGLVDAMGCNIVYEIYGRKSPRTFHAALKSLWDLDWMLFISVDYSARTRTHIRSLEKMSEFLSQ